MDFDGAAGGNDGSAQPGKPRLFQHPLPRRARPQVDLHQPWDAGTGRFGYSQNRQWNRGLAMDPVFYFALTFTVFLVFALIFAPVLLRPSPAARRMMEMVRSNRPDERRVGTKERMQ